MLAGVLVLLGNRRARMPCFSLHASRVRSLGMLYSVCIKYIHHQYERRVFFLRESCWSGSLTNSLICSIAGSFVELSQIRGSINKSYSNKVGKTQAFSIHKGPMDSIHTLCTTNGSPYQSTLILYRGPIDHPGCYTYRADD